MLLPRWQTTERGNDFCACQFQSICNSHPFQHFCQNGTAGQRGRTTVSEKSHGFDAAITYAQTQAQAIAADRICFFSDCVCVGEFARVARMRQMIFEGFRI